MAWGTAQKFYSYNRKCQAWVSYSQTANNDTSTTYSVTGYARSGDGSGYYYASDYGVTVRISYKIGNGAWTTLGSQGATLNYGNNVGSITRSFTVTKTHASQAVQFRCEAISTSGDWDTATATLSATVGAKTSYAIDLDENKPSAASASVTDMPADQTKWHGEELVLPNTSPTLSLYNFIGWNTAADGTGTAYAAGGSYTSNAAATLYAQWELAYAFPTIDPATVIRCNSSGTEADDGTYGKVSFTWAIDTTADDGGNVGKRAVISWKPTTTASWDNASSVTITLSGTGGTINRVFGTISTDASYDVRIAVTDTHTIDGNECTAYRFLTLSQAFFTLDFLEGGHGVGMGIAATQEDTFELAMDFNHHDGGVALDATSKAAWLSALGLGDTGWRTIAGDAPAKTSHINGMRVRRIGNVVQFDLRAGGAWNGGTIGTTVKNLSQTIPAGFRPASYVQFPGSVPGADIRCYAAVNAGTGVVSIYCSTSTYYYTFSTTWLTEDDWPS